MNSPSSIIIDPGDAVTDIKRRLPAEWERQSAVMVAWPHAETDWRELLPEVWTCYAEITAAIACFEAVLICVANEALKQHVQSLLRTTQADQSKIIFATVPYNDTWTRDYGPICIAGPHGQQLLDFQFNGWGGRYSAQFDNQVSFRLHASGYFGDHELVPVFWVLEGGAIDTDGQGVALTTERCITHYSRNDGPDRSQVEKIFQRQLGIRRVLWLSHGDLEGDDTDGHIDQLARFCTPDTIAYCSDEGSDAQARSLQDMAKELRSFYRQDGKPYKLVPLPVPQPIFNKSGKRLPASYVNFLVINDAVLVPQYNDPADTIATQRLRTCFPQREIIAVPARALIEQGGSVHCATMQLPAGILTATPSKITS